jgi:hypothetical protein
MPKKKAKTGLVHQGGGCLVRGKGRCCDDTYLDVGTRQTVTVYSTPDVHFSLPDKVKDVEALKRFGARLTAR